MRHIYVEVRNRRDTSELIYYIDQLLNDPRVKEIFCDIEITEKDEVVAKKATPKATQKVA